MPKKLTELLREAVAKNQTEEGRRELREQPERMEAEEVQTAQKAAQASPAHPEPEADEDVQTAPGGPQAVEEPSEVRPENRIDPILPVVVGTVKGSPRAGGRTAGVRGGHRRAEVSTGPAPPPPSAGGAEGADPRALGLAGRPDDGASLVSMMAELSLQP